MDRPKFELADIFRRYGKSYREKHGVSMSTAQRCVMTAVEVCRTAALGGQIEQCDQCGHRRFCYRSCRNRHCPKCQSLARAEWIQHRQAELLDCEYFHVVFTVPEEIASIAYQNKEVVCRSLRIVREKFLPRVLSRDEGSRFLQACAQLPPGQGSPIRAAVLGTALRVLYLTGLRAGELLRLTHADLDLESGTLRIRHSKFNKSRLVPLAPDLVQRVVECRAATGKRQGPCQPDTPLFPSPRGGRYSSTALRGAFHDALKIAGIERTTDSRIRLHDLRHSFAGLRLLLWCEQNVDLGAKLPLLAAYLGHVGLASSQRYLQLTRDLMGEITRRHQARFGHLIQEEGH